MVDFSRLALRPSMGAFARQITVTPRKSQPNAAPYAARGIYTEVPVDIATAEGEIVALSARITLGVRLSEFAVPPVQGDRIRIESAPQVYALDDVNADGQGGAVWILKKVPA